MIKKIELKPFKNSQLFPAYVYKKGIETYTLNASLSGGYKIMLGKIIVGNSISNGAPLCHAMFESYTKHGEKMIETKTRVSGYEREFNAVKQVMMEAGVEFEPIAPCHPEELLNALGARYKADNPDIQSYAVVSQTCH